MTVEFHADRYGGRPVGRPRTGQMSSKDPLAVARAAKQLIQSGDWRHQAGSDDRTKVLVSLRSKLPLPMLTVVAESLPTDALVALTRELPPGGCAWCCALVQRLPDLPELDRTPALVALLGEGCRRCRNRWAVDARVAALVDEAREQARLAAGQSRPPEQPLVATAGPPPTPAPAGRRAVVPPPSGRRKQWPKGYERLPWPDEDAG